MVSERGIWRILAIGLTVLWMSILLINWHYMVYRTSQPNPSVGIPDWLYLGFGGCTLIGLAVLIAYPMLFSLYACVFFFWGVINLIDGGDAAGLILVILGCGFAYKKHFFDAFIKVKGIAIGLVVFLAIISQYRYGLEYLTKTTFRCILVVLAGAIGMLLFASELRRMGFRRNSPTEPAEPEETWLQSMIDGLSDEDKALLLDILSGDKYEVIAIKHGIAISTLKKRANRLYKVLQVTDRTRLLAEYSGVQGLKSGS